MPKTTISRQLARYVNNLSYDKLPGEVIEKIKTLFLHGIGVGLAAYDTETAQIALKVAKKKRGDGATILVDGRKVLPPAAVFLGALVLTMTFRLAPLDQTLDGFSNSGMLTVGALFMVAAGMYSTGAITVITEKLIGLPKTLLGAQLKILPSVSIGSAFLNNTPLVAMMIPVIRDLSKSCRLAASRLYIPLSYASILGGTCTLIGTATNLVISGMVIDSMAEAGPSTPYMREIGMFDGVNLAGWGVG